MGRRFTAVGSERSTESNYPEDVMKTLPLSVLFFSCFLIAVSVCTAQRTIVISDSLGAHADILDVKKGAVWMGSMPAWSFGSYAVVSSKNSWSGSEKENLFKTEMESKSKNSFSFVLTNGAGDSSWVTAAHNVTIKALEKLDLGNGFFLGSDEVVGGSDIFTALITLHGDTATWMLLMGIKRPNTKNEYEAILTNGERRIVLSGVTSDRPGSHEIPPAVGYEFMENGSSLGAVQFFGGPFGMTYLVWIDRRLDKNMKLVLAAAMTAALQLNSR